MLSFIFLVPVLIGIKFSSPIAVNLYIPRFTGSFSLEDVDLIDSCILGIRSSYPECKLVLGGDWNADFFRTQRVPVEDRILKIIRELQRDDFARFPSTNVPTYGDRALTTIDYFLVSSSLQPANFTVGAQHGCQHFPIELDIELPKCLVTVQG